MRCGYAERCGLSVLFHADKGGVNLPQLQALADGSQRFSDKNHPKGFGTGDRLPTSQQEIHRAPHGKPKTVNVQSASGE
jgi:hypothetical protein